MAQVQYQSYKKKRVVPATGIDPMLNFRLASGSLRPLPWKTRWIPKPTPNPPPNRRSEAIRLVLARMARVGLPSARARGGREAAGRPAK